MKDKKDQILKLYFIISFLIVFVFSFIVFYVFEIQVKDIKLEELKQDEESLVDFQNQLLGDQFRTVLGDIHYLHHVYGDRLSSDENIDYISKDWIEFSNQRRIYDQIRFIDKFGDEVIRINYNDNEASLLEKSKLQNKKDRYYFYETKDLKNEAVFVSPLDLNVEEGEIEIPFKPMIRFSTPLYDQDGEFQGVIVLNYLGNTALDDFRELAKNSNGIFALLNSDSYWLSCEDEDNEWNFMFEEKKHDMFSKHYPEEWKTITQEKGQILTENGLFTFAPVHLNHNYTKGSDYQIDDNINLSDSKWYIVSLINTENELATYFLDDPILTIKDVFKKNNYQLLLIAVISIIVGSLVYLNRKKYYKIKFFSEYDSLTKTLNRRAGYTQIQKLIYKNERRDVSFSLCFIDVNGLKQVNDNLGHEYGDELLTTVCDTISSNIREFDFLIRQGGDEFLIVFNRIDIEESEKIWKRIVSKFNEINENNNRSYIVSVSHGIVEYNNTEEIDIDELIKLADDKMYKEKKIMKENFHVLRKS